MPPSTPLDPACEPLDPRTFRQVLGQFATGVCVVTARTADGEPVGLTMSSFNSVSLDPPLVLFSVDRRAHSLPALRSARGFGINILGQGQRALSDRFARALADKWEQVEHHGGVHDVPLIAGALAHLECVPHAIHDGGDHEIFLARVLRVSAVGADAPLIFFRGGYHGLASPDMPQR